MGAAEPDQMRRGAVAMLRHDLQSELFAKAGVQAIQQPDQLRRAVLPCAGGLQELQATEAPHSVFLRFIRVMPVQQRIELPEKSGQSRHINRRQRGNPVQPALFQQFRQQTAGELQGTLPTLPALRNQKFRDPFRLK
ncbi:hypothetical protein SDC9_198154 [bioreactor metagenome]|uniref:Uncharacterized protein n=1 Tax=bioreactor metagenome TaxID=1076179 RepID=A0A645IGV8_9ZZZZ